MFPQSATAALSQRNTGAPILTASEDASDETEKRVGMEMYLSISYG